MSPDQRRTLDELARDLDLLVYRLEAPAPGAAEPQVEGLLKERKRLRRDLERLRDRLQDVVDGLW